MPIAQVFIEEELKKIMERLETIKEKDPIFVITQTIADISDKLKLSYKTIENEIRIIQEK